MKNFILLMALLGIALPLQAQKIEVSAYTRAEKNIIPPDSIIVIQKSTGKKFKSLESIIDIPLLLSVEEENDDIKFSILNQTLLITSNRSDFESVELIDILCNKVNSRIISQSNTSVYYDLTNLTVGAYVVYAKSKFVSKSFKFLANYNSINPVIVAPKLQDDNLYTFIFYNKKYYLDSEAIDITKYDKVTFVLDKKIPIKFDSIITSCYVAKAEEVQVTSDRQWGSTTFTKTVSFGDSYAIPWEKGANCINFADSRYKTYYIWEFNRDSLTIKINYFRQRYASEDCGVGITSKLHFDQEDNLIGVLHDKECINNLTIYSFYMIYSGIAGPNTSVTVKKIISYDGASAYIKIVPCWE